MKERNPWDQNPEIWKNKEVFHQSMRNISRRAWNKLPLKFIYKKSKTYKKKVGVFKNGRVKNINYCKCEICDKEEMASKCQVDHIKPAGSFNDREGFKEWFARLIYIGGDELQVLCQSCHSKKTYAERAGISFNESAKLEPLRKFLALKAKDQKSYLEEKGFKKEEINNVKNREKSFKKCCL